jgi:CubicO group peptidase (beta-lactamase class C family)
VPLSWTRPQTWLLLIVLAIGALITFVAGLHLYVTATATPLHPDPDTVPSAVATAPAGEWIGAVGAARRVVREALIGQNLPGVSVAVGAGDEIVWAEGFGWANLDDRVPVTPDTRFRMGTASKVIASAAAGLLLERHRLALDAEIQTYVPAFPRKPWPVTLRHLMAHQAGLGNDGGDEGPLYSRHCDRPVEALPAFADDDLRFQPGTGYRYSNYGWILVSAAIEQAAGEPFLGFVRAEVLDPLGMADTRADAGGEALPHRATPYFPRYAADPRYGPHVMRDIDLSCYAGAGVLVSTPSDLVRFGLAINGGKLLKPATVDLLQAPQRLASGEETGYGLGWDLETIALAGREARAAGHDGGVLGGPVVSLITLRERGIAVAVMSNTSYAETFAIASKVAEAFAAGPTPPPSAAGRRPRRLPYSGQGP